MTFVLLDIGGVAWGAYMDELGISTSTLTSGAAVNYAGLAMGCVLFIPFVYKYGRRPIYIVSLLVQFATSIWNAKLNTGAELVANNLVMGLGGAISETIVLLTIVDLYFVHHHATMNAIFVLLQFGGTYLGPVAAGYIVDSQGWRWIWWWTAILIGACLVVVLFCFEESQYVPTLQGHAVRHLPTTTAEEIAGNDKDLKQATEASNAAEPFNAPGNIDILRVPSNERCLPVAQNRPRKSYRQRMALYTKSPSSYSMRVHFFQPVWIVCHIPAVAFAATMYGAVLAWFSVLWTIEATYMYLPPYNFDASSVGLLNLAPFIGCLLAACLSGPLSDWSILFLSKRNQGVFEPEMPGLLMFGIGLAHVSLDISPPSICVLLRIDSNLSTTGRTLGRARSRLGNVLVCHHHDHGCGDDICDRLVSGRE
ncbi:hypothetical protein CLAIMM_12485 [Cladophialophora immunda]|nr:hypothetical protein CLAIMM_12485 [Cladophialophora immunda]